MLYSSDRFVSIIGEFDVILGLSTRESDKHNPVFIRRWCPKCKFWTPGPSNGSRSSRIYTLDETFKVQSKESVLV